MERFITHSAPETLFRSREWRPGRWTSKSYQIFCCLEKSDEKKLGNFGLKQDTFIFSSKILIIRIDPMFLRVLATIHSTFCLKRPKKKMYQKATAKVSANPTHQNGSALWNEVGNGSEATQKIQSLKFIWSISYVCIIKRIWDVQYMLIDILIYCLYIFSCYSVSHITLNSMTLL